MAYLGATSVGGVHLPVNQENAPGAGQVENPSALAASGGPASSDPKRIASPFEVAYSFFFLFGIGSVAYNIVVPAFSKRVGFTDQNDLQIWLMLIAIMAVVIFQLSRIYFVLHHISE